MSAVYSVGKLWIKLEIIFMPQLCTSYSVVIINLLKLELKH